MNEYLIMVIEKSLNDYRRAMFKAGKNLEKKADINRKTAIELINFLDSEREISIEASKNSEIKQLNIADVIWRSEQLKAYAEFLANTLGFENYSNKDLAIDYCDSL